MKLALEDLQGEYAFYEDRDRWVPRYQRQIEQRRLTPYQVGQGIFGNHHSGRFRTDAEPQSVIAGSTVKLRIRGITPYGPMAVIGGRLDGPPAEAFGKIVMPFEESLDALVRIPEDAEAGLHVFFSQQWEPEGTPAYPGGRLIYLSTMVSVEVHTRVDEGTFWQSFEPWSKEDADNVRENIRRSRERLQG